MMLNSTDGMFIQISADVKDALAKLDNLDATLNDVMKSVKLDVDTSNLDKAKSSLNDIASSARQAASASKALGESLKSFGSQLTHMADSYINAVRGIFDKIKGFAVAGAASIGATLKSAFDVGGGFESSMTSVKVISGATAEQFDLLTAKARELGATLPITAQDAANAMTVMAQRGTSVKDILASVTDVTNLAISQNISLADAAEILGSAMTNFGIATSEASRVTDIFNNASNQSALTMTKLREALKFVAPTANAAGMALEQAMAAMEVLANSGFDGSMIGSGLSMTISKIAAATEILDVKTQDAQGNMRALADIFAELNQRGVTLSEMTDIFGERAAKMALSLVKSADSLGAFERNLKSLGSTQSAVQQQMNTWQNTVAGLGSALESVRLTVFDQLKEKAKGTVGSLSDMVRAFDTWLTKTGAAGKTLKAFMDGFGVGLPSLEAFKKALSSFNLDAFLQKIKNLGDTVRHVFETLKTFASIAVTAFNTVYAVVGKHTGVIGDFIQKFLGISYAAKVVGGSLTGLVNILTGSIGVFQKISGVLTSVGGAFLSAIPSVTSFGSALAALTGGGIIAGVAAGLGLLISKAKETSDAMSEMRASAAQARNLEFKLKLKESARAQFDELKKELKTGFEKVSSESILDENLISQFEELRKKLQDKSWQQYTNYVRLFNSKLSETEKVLSITENALENFRPQLIKAFSGDTQALEALPEQLKIVFEAFKKGIGKDGQDVGLEFINGIKTAVKDAWVVLDDTLEGKQIKIDTTPIEAATERARAGVEEILKNFVSGVQASYDVLGDYGDSVADNIGAVASAVDELAKTMGEKLPINATTARRLIESTFQQMAASGNQAARTIFDSLNTIDTAPLEEAAVRAQAGVGEILKNFISGVQSSYNVLGDYGNSIADNIGDVTDAVDKLAKTMGEKLPINATTARRLIEGAFQRTAASGNQAAQIILGAIKKPEEEVESLTGKFRDFVSYLGASPAEFMPALKQMLSNIQVIDPATGNVTEAFKKAYAAVKEFASMTLSKLKSQIDGVASAVKKGLLDKTALKSPTQQYKVSVYADMQDNFDWDAFGGRKSQQAMAVFVSQFMDALKEVDAAAASEMQSHFNKLTQNWNWSKEAASSQLYKDLENQMSKLSKSAPVKTQLEQEVKLPDMTSLAQSFTQYGQQQAGFVQQTQQNAVQIANTGQALISAMGGLQHAIELNTASQDIGSSGGNTTVTIDTSRIESICSSIESRISNLTQSAPVQSQEANLPDVTPLVQSFEQYGQQAQQNTAQVASTGQSLVSSMSSLQRALELNTASQSAGSSGESASVNVDTSRLEAICSSIMNLITGVQTDVQGHGSLLTAISNAIANITGDTVNNYSYDLDINQTGFTVQSKGDADSIARQTASAIRNGLGLATA